jgi:TonB family protein
MQTFASLISTALCILVLTPSEAATPAASAAPDGPRFAASDEIPDSKGYDDAYALYEVKLGGVPITEAEQLTRWQDELKGGRARAGVLAGGYLAYRALIPADCDAARAALLQADQLGSDQAAWSLAKLAENTSCGQVERAQWEPWLKKAVALDYLSAAQRLIDLYAISGTADDTVQRYIYARVASSYWAAVNINKNDPPRTEFAPAALLEMEKTLSPADRTRAEAESAKILAVMLKRHERFASVAPVEFARGGAGGKIAHTFVGFSLDYRHECQWNLTGNCKGAQRLGYADLTNKSANFLGCKVVLTTPDFVTAAATTLSREVLIGPGATRRLILGDTTLLPDKKALTTACTALPDLAANATAGKCRARLKGTLNVDDYYPPSAVARGIEGSVVVRYWLPAGSDVPVDAEVATSSGDASLDDAAIATVRSGTYTKDCDYGLGTLKIAFKLKN